MITSPLGSWVCAAFVMMVTTACSGESAAGDNDDPVKQTALAGTIAGTAFKAVSAVAQPGFDDDGTRSISVYEDVVTCADGFGGGASERMVLFSVPWKDGFEASFSLQQNATLVPSAGDNLVATEGRVEVVSAPAAGEKGKLRIRAFFDEDNQVEGEVEVEVCADR